MFFCLEVGRFYGGGTKYKSVWDRMSQINKHAETLRDAIQSGIDPITVELNEVSSGAVKPKAKGRPTLPAQVLFTFFTFHFALLELLINLLIHFPQRWLSDLVETVPNLHWRIAFAASEQMPR